MTLIFKKLREEIFLVLATIFLTSLLGLIIVESYYWNSPLSSVCGICRFHPELGWETKPSKSVKNRVLTYTTNSMGMRSEEIDPARGHILILGDSVAFGVGVNNNETISHYLEQDKRIDELGYQVLLGTSRKRFMGDICKVNTPIELAVATATTTVLGVQAGVDIFRVHDVKENRQAADTAWEVLKR